VEESSSEDESDTELCGQTHTQASTPSVLTPLRLPQPPAPLYAHQVHPGSNETASAHVPDIDTGKLKY